MHSVVPSPRGHSEWQHPGMTGATMGPGVSSMLAAAPGFHTEQSESRGFQRDAGPTVLEPELAAGREAAGLFFVVYFIKISFLFLFILMDTISRCTRGTQVGPDRTPVPGVGRVYFRLLRPQECLQGPGLL